MALSSKYNNSMSARIEVTLVIDYYNHYDI